MMKYTPLTRIEKKPITRAATAAAPAGSSSAETIPGDFRRARAATYPPTPKKAE
jgi:hypothetical protein